MPAGPDGRPTRRWSWSAAILVALAVVVGFVAGQATRRLDAQVVKPARATVYTYRQSHVFWQRIAVTLNEWTDKGWELVQIVPVINSNPGAGGDMQAVIVMRRPAGQR
jgi:hypothetical protein